MNRRNGEAILLGEVNLAPADVREVPRRRGRRRAAHGARLRRQPGALPVAGARVGRAAGESAARVPGAARVGLAGALRAQPRRADPRQALRGRARRGLRALRRRSGRCSSTVAGCGAGCRRCSTATSARSGWSTRSRSRSPARRCCSTARRSAWPRTSRSRAATASARRCSGRPTAASRSPTTPCRPLVEGAFGPARVNVSTQRRDPDSLLNWFERLIRRRRECPEFGFGELTLLETGAPSVLAHRCDWEGETIVAVHELGGEPGHDRAADRGRRWRSSTSSATPSTPLPATLDLEPYAAHWFRVRREGGGCRPSRRVRAACRTGGGRAWSGGRCGPRPAGASCASPRPGARARRRCPRSRRRAAGRRRRAGGAPRCP